MTTDILIKEHSTGKEEMIIITTHQNVYAAPGLILKPRSTPLSAYAVSK
jgi:hypothetical protein